MISLTMLSLTWCYQCDILMPRDCRETKARKCMTGAYTQSSGMQLDIYRALVWHPNDATANRIAVFVSSLGCLLMQSVWTDGSSILSVGLDQRLRCWKLSLRESQQSSTNSGAGSMPAADNTHSKTSADAVAVEAVVKIQEAESYATQVLEPAALHVAHRKTEHEQRSGWVVGVVGRGTELIHYTRTS